MDKLSIQKTKAQLNETRRWFYLNARDILGVDITGIPLPREESTVSGVFYGGGAPEDAYEYLEPTEFDRLQAAEQVRPLNEDAPTPKIYLAMGNFLNAAVQYVELRENLAEGESTRTIQGQERNLERALKEVEQAASTVPFHEAKNFIQDIAHHARVVHFLITGEKPLTFEAAESKLVHGPQRGR
jgi:hypothetical protein